MDTTQSRIELACAVLLLFIVLIVGPAIERREQMASERIDLPPAPARTTWAERPNESRCGWPCIERLPTTGETWGE